MMNVWTFVRKSLAFRQLKPDSDAVDKVGDLTSGEFAAVVIDATGHAGAMMAAVNYCGHSANLVYVGLTKGDITFTHTEIHKRELTILCSRNATREDFSRVTELMKSGTVVPSCMVTHRSSFEEMPQVFDDWLKPESGVIKAVVEIS